MKHNRLIQLACALTLTSPLAAQWQDCGFNEIYNRPYWDTCDSGIYLELDYLLWFAIQDGISPSTTLDLGGSSTNRGQELTVHSKDNFFRNNWDSGVRAVVGVKPPCKDWDARLGFTHYFTQERKSTSPMRRTFFAGDLPSSAFGQEVVPEFINPSADFTGIGSQFTTKNKALWRLTFNQLDLDFGREFYVACDVTLRPYFGVRGLETNERLQLFYKDDVLRGSSSIAATMDGKSHFRGVGAKGGFDTTITLVDGFDLWGSFSGSIIWGYSRIRQAFNEDVVFGLLNGKSNAHQPKLNEELTIINHTSHSHQATVFNLDLGMGLRWNQWMNNGRSLLSFKFGWEQHLFSNLNQLQQNVLYTLFNPKSRASQVALDNNVYRGYLSLSGFLFGLSYYY